MSDDSIKTRVTRISTTGRPPELAKRPGDACIVVIYGPEIGRRVTLTGATFEIGRSSKCDLFIDQESISRRHARIIFDGSSYVIEDLQSTNGTIVNDVVVQRRKLVDGDQIRLGRSILKFMTGENVEVHYHEEIYRLMTMDALTQIFNRRYFNEALERELNRSRRYGRELSLLLFDIDYFKRINDTYGHLAGDGILRQVAAALRQKLRREDIFARTGGEEFGVLLPEIGISGARITAEKCRRTIESTTMSYDDRVIPVTISVGVAMLQNHATPEELYKAADDQLYAAKQSGRNRVCG